MCSDSGHRFVFCLCTSPDPSLTPHPSPVLNCPEDVGFRGSTFPFQSEKGISNVKCKINGVHLRRGSTPRGSDEPSGGSIDYESKGHLTERGGRSRYS